MVGKNNPLGGPDPSYVKLQSPARSLFEYPFFVSINPCSIPGTNPHAPAGTSIVSCFVKGASKLRHKRGLSWG